MAAATTPFPGPLDRRLRFAIAHKRLVQLDYTGRRRLVEPHDYGIKNGAVMLLVYQLRGGTEGRPTGWRLLDVGKIEACAVLDATFPGGRGDASQRHTAWDELWARVEPARGGS